MKSTEFGAAIWGFDWDLFPADTAIQGTANLSDDGIYLDIPFGCLLWSGGIVIPERACRPPEEVDYLYGFTQTGDWLVLKDCFPTSSTTSFPGGKRQRICANFLFSSKERFDPTAKIEEMEIGITGFAEWYGETPLYETIDADTMWFKSVEFDSEKSKAMNEILFEDESYALTVKHAYSASSVKVGGFTFSHESYLKVTLKNKKSFEEMLQLVVALQDFFVLSMGFFGEIEFLRLKCEGVNKQVNCYGCFYKGKEPTKRQLQEMPFPRRRIRGSEAEVFESLLHADRDLSEAINLASSLIGRNWDIPFSLEALASSQCLEVLSRIGVELNSIDPDDYSRIVQTIKDSVVDKDALKWISERMPGNRKGQQRLLSELVGRHQSAFEWAVSDVKKYVTTQVALRNSLTHVRNDEERGFDDQYWCAKATVLIALFIIWEMLGLASTDIINAFEESRYMDHVLGELKTRSI